MGKKDDSWGDLPSLVKDYLQSGDSSRLMEAIENHSNLPGPRANLELAAAFGDLMEEMAHASGDQLWELCLGFVTVTPEEGPVNDPKEFIPFCGAVGIGALGSRLDTFYDEALTTLRELSRDRRWRLREAVRMGLQRILRAHTENTLEDLQHWIPEGNPLEMRAVAASVSDLEFLLDQSFANRALDLHKEILDKIGCIKDRKAKSFRVLRKALGYTLSILICALPEAGLELIDELITSKDTDLIWIARSNLKKRRVLRNFPEEAEGRLKGL
jgi:hypothetical protein